MFSSSAAFMQRLLPVVPAAGGLHPYTRFRIRYQSRESGTEIHFPPSRTDCWLIKPGSVMSSAA